MAVENVLQAARSASSGALALVVIHVVVPEMSGGETFKPCAPRSPPPAVVLARRVHFRGGPESIATGTPRRLIEELRARSP